MAQGLGNAASSPATLAKPDWDSSLNVLETLPIKITARRPTPQAEAAGTRMVLIHVEGIKLEPANCQHEGSPQVSATLGMLQSRTCNPCLIGARRQRGESEAAPPSGQDVCGVHHVQVPAVCAALHTYSQCLKRLAPNSSMGVLHVL